MDVHFLLAILLLNMNMNAQVILVRQKEIFRNTE